MAASNVRRPGGMARCFPYLIPFQSKKIIYSVWRDISERKQSEEQLRESEELFRVVIENANDGIVLVKGDMRVYANNSFLNMFGYSRQEDVVGKPDVLLQYTRTIWKKSLNITEKGWQGNRRLSASK